MFVRLLCPSADFHLVRSPCVAARCRSHAAPAQWTNATGGDTFVTIHPPLDFFVLPLNEKKQKLIGSLRHLDIKRHLFLFGAFLPYAVENLLFISSREWRLEKNDNTLTIMGCSGKKLQG